ncbi:hypothetical protein [Pseudomonas asplenii]|uniref:hypothetical protein n=1 Tax=Pseudomonas asplenii TaxID=53407 RepID=UPI002FC29B4B
MSGDEFANHPLAPPVPEIGKHDRFPTGRIAFRHRAAYNCHRTYATIDAMSGLNPRIHRPTIGSQPADAAVAPCLLAQLKLRLERAGNIQDWYRIDLG